LSPIHCKGKGVKNYPDLIARKRTEHMSAIEEFSSNEQPIRPERFVTDLANVLPSNALVILIVLTNSSFGGIKAERVADPAFLAG
jgi:hypothetical protein